MEAIFLKIFNMSITAGWLALAVILLRFLLKKVPKWLTVLLWGLVGLRLVCPWSLESVFSLIPSAETLPQNITSTQTPQIHSGISYLNSTINPVISETLAPTPEKSVTPMETVMLIAAVVWLCGVALMLLYTAVSFIKIRKSVREAVALRDNIWECDGVSTPFILGIFKPRIYLPSDLSESDFEYVIAHEKAHLKRRDHLIKPLSFLLLSVYWFNPLLWVAYVLLCRDIELACDEKVIKQMGSDSKKPYSTALINCSVSHRSITACPLAFGEVGVKSRIKAVLSYKKPEFWVVIVAVVTSVVVAVCFLTNPKGDSEKGQPLKNLDGLQLEEVLENTVNVCIGNGEYYLTKIEPDRKILNEVINLRVSADPIVDDIKAENYKHLILLQSESDITFSLSSAFNSKGTMIIFNDDFSTVRFGSENDGDMTAYKVLNPQKAQQLFESIKESCVTDYTTTESEIDTLREKFPEYFDLPTAKGLEVYIWQMSKDNYQCGLMAGTNRNKFDEEIMNLKPASIVEMRLILSTYSLPTTNMILIAYQHPLSSYRYKVDDAYYEQLHEVFWDKSILSSFGGADYPEQITDLVTAVYGYIGSPDPVRPTLRLTKGLQTFNFSWSGYSSYVAVGNYELSDSLLKCFTSDGLYHYTFQVTGDRFKFLASESSPIPSYKYSQNGKEQCPVPDGAIFEPIVPETMTSYSPVFATAEFDIDGDGIEESVLAGAGPTSGIYTFRMYANSKNGEYYNVFMPGSYGKPSLVIENGKLILQMTHGDVAENYYVSTYHHNIVLTLEDSEKTMPFWGNQIKKQTTIETLVPLF